MSLKSAFYAMFRGERSQTELEQLRGDLEALESLGEELLARPAKSHQTQLASVFLWHARAYATIGDCLLEVDAKEDPATAGYVPEVTFEQVKALYSQMHAALQKVKRALHEPHYLPDKPLPIPLKPRVLTEEWPMIYLSGLCHAASSLASRIKASWPPPHPEELSARLQALQDSLLVAEGQLTKMRTGKGRTQSAQEELSDELWRLLSELFLLGQLLAMPSLAESTLLAGYDVTAQNILFEERWMLSHPEAKQKLQGDKEAERQLKTFWEQKGWRTTHKQERFTAQCKKLLQEGALEYAGYQPQCPFAPIYRALRSVTILDSFINSGVSFYLLMSANRDAITVVSAG